MTDTSYSAGHYPTYQDMLTKVDWNGMGGGRRRARSRCEELHGSLRLRSQWCARNELPEARQLEEFQIQFLSASAGFPETRS